jgi:hypothetical protein
MCALILFSEKLRYRHPLPICALSARGRHTLQVRHPSDPPECLPSGAALFRATLRGTQRPSADEHAPLHHVPSSRGKAETLRSRNLYTLSA